MDKGIPDLPRTLQAVLSRVDPSLRTRLMTDVFQAPPEKIGERLERWWGIVTRFPTPEQCTEAVRAVEAGDDLGSRPIEDFPDLHARFQEIEREWDENPEKRRAALEEQRQEQVRWKAEMLEWIDVLEMILAEQKRYWESLRDEEFTV